MDFKEYIKQLSIVILGILIAYWVSNIGSNYNERKTQKQILQTILNELQDNHENTKESLSSLDTLKTIYTQIRYTPTLSDSFTINYIGLSLKSIGYETAKYTGILKNVDYKLTSRIVQNYESQNSLVKTEELMIDQLFTMIKNKTNKDKEVDYLLLLINNLESHLTNFDKNQEQLIEYLQATEQQNE